MNTESEFKGFRWIKFHETLKIMGWDMAWDLDNNLKNEDRVGIVRILPSIRLCPEGYVAMHPEQESKTIASKLTKTGHLARLVSIKREGSARYAIEICNVVSGRNSAGYPVTYNWANLDGKIQEHTPYVSLSEALEQFAVDWAGNIETPIDYAKLVKNKPIEAPVVSRAEIYQDFGTWS